MTVYIRFIMLLAVLVMVAAGCQRNYRTPPSGTLLYAGGPPGGPPPTPGGRPTHGVSRLRTPAPSMSLNVLGRYQSIASKIVTGEPVYIHHSRDGKNVNHWLIPHFYWTQPAQATVSNSYTVVQVDNGIWYADGTCPVIITTKIRSVGTGTTMIVEINPGADFTTDADDIHRAYFLGPDGHGVDVYPASGGRPTRLKNLGEYVECGPDNVITAPELYTGNDDLVYFVKSVLYIVENMYR